MKARLLLSTNLIFMMAACSKPSPSSLHEESSEPFVNIFTDLSLGSGDLDRAAMLFGLIDGGNPASASCTSCHAEFGSYDGLNELAESTYWATSCFEADYRGHEAALKALTCLAQRAEGKAEASKDLSTLPADDLKAALLALRPKDLGFLTAGLAHKAIVGVFKDAAMEDIYDSVLKNVGMPYREAAMADRDFEITLTAISWGSFNDPRFIRYDGPDVCRTESEGVIGEKIKEHVRRMSEEGEGWNFINLARGVAMFACSGNDPRDCFNQQKDGSDVFPERQDWLAPGVRGKIRELHAFTASTSYWTRSSADGRYVASGGFNNDSSIIDLMPLLQGREARRISVKADFDPSFSPDNQAFMFQGDHAGSRICRQSLLAKEDLTTIDFLQEGCSREDLDIGLYQAIGNDQVSGDIVAVAGNFLGDSGDERYYPETPIFGKTSQIEVTTVKPTSDGFEKAGRQTIPTPYEANWMMSPSQKLLVSVVSAATDGFPRHGGYRLVLTDGLRETNTLPSREDAESASICTGAGEKATFSFDERYLTYYAYEKQGKTLSWEDSSSDVYLVDLLGDGKARKITAMPKGSYAQFPHFRSDGWLYFTVLDGKTRKSKVMAAFIESILPSDISNKAASGDNAKPKD